MKYRAKIYMGVHRYFSVTSVPFDDFRSASCFLDHCRKNIEQATGGHIEQYVDGIGWVVAEETEEGE